MDVLCYNVKKRVLQATLQHLLSMACEHTQELFACVLKKSKSQKVFSAHIINNFHYKFCLQNCLCKLQDQVLYCFSHHLLVYNIAGFEICDQYTAGVRLG